MMPLMNMTIKSKLIFNVIVVTVGILLIGGLFLYSHDKTDVILKRIDTLNYLEQVSAQMENALIKSMSKLSDVILLNDLASESNVLAESENFMNKFELFRGTAESAGITNDYSLASENENVVLDVRTGISQCILLYKQHEYDSALNAYTQLKNKQVRTLLNFIDNCKYMREENISEERKKITLTEQHNLQLTAALFILILLITFLMNFKISRYISRSLAAFSKNIAFIHKTGDLSREVEIKSKDEIGNFALILNNMLKTYSDLSVSIEQVAAGSLDINVPPRSDQDSLALSFNKMIHALKEQSFVIRKREWISEGSFKLNAILREEKKTLELGNKICSFLADFLGIQIAALYLSDESKLHLSGSFAFSKRKQLGSEIELGEGIAGQAALEKKLISVMEVPEDYTRINSATGSSAPLNIVVSPFVYNNELIGVVEMGSFKEIKDDSLDFLKSITEPVAIGFINLKYKEKLQKLLEASQQQTEELQAQQEELKVANEELEVQTSELQKSKEKLQAQQEELRVSNEELEEKTEALERQKKEIERQNRNLTVSEQELIKKSNELQISNKYKSEFLANMSHELRTPLNSLLLLAKKFATNKEGNLNEKQVKNAEIIYNSGCDLLNLINELLDLAKIEAGKMDIVIDSLSPEALKNKINDNFEHLVKDKDIIFSVNIDGTNMPDEIMTDTQKFEQIIKNLVSNAIKFTSKGSISVNMFHPRKDDKIKAAGLDPEKLIAVSVADTGIGIPEDKIKLIFEAFQQGDGSTSRVYGGTGLGLTISRELSKLLGGEIILESKVGEGSVFTVYINQNLTQKTDVKPVAAPAVIEKTPVQESSVNTKTEDSASALPYIYPSLPDDRNSITKNDNTILIIEDDLNFAHLLYEICKEKGYKCIHTSEGVTGFKLAEEYQPSGILLDIYLPESNGLDILDKLKDNLSTRHIPVHILSAEDNTIKSIQKGAVNFIQKPVDKEKIEDALKKMLMMGPDKSSNILLIEDDENQGHAIKEIINFSNVFIDIAHTGNDGIKKFENAYYDLVILDLDLPDISGFEVMEKIKLISKVKPIIVYTGMELTPQQKVKLARYSASTILKVPESAERLLDEVSLFLHTETSQMSDDKRKILLEYHNSDLILEGKTVLVVDDDVRNLYLLEEELKELNINVIKAANGQMAVDAIEKNSNIDIVIMDIMMPVMDGYQAMSLIRRNPKTSSLPIIALTAKAMKEDRQKCIDAGANDYLTKPLDINKLTTLMKVLIKNKGLR